MFVRVRLKVNTRKEKVISDCIGIYIEGTLLTNQFVYMSETFAAVRLYFCAMTVWYNNSNL